MKIVLEDHDISEIVRAHVVSTNLLGLADKEFNVVIDYDTVYETVSGTIDTSIAAIPPASVEKPKQRRKRRSAAVDEKPTEESDNVQPIVASPEAEEVKTDDPPPFEAAEKKEDEPKPASKSLFG